MQRQRPHNITARPLCRPTVELLEERRVLEAGGLMMGAAPFPPAGPALVQEPTSDVLPAVEIGPSDGGVTPPIAGPTPGTGDASLPDAAQPGPLNPIPGQAGPGNPPAQTGDDLVDQTAPGVIPGAFPELVPGFANQDDDLPLAEVSDAALGIVLLQVDNADGGIGDFVVATPELIGLGDVRVPDPPPPLTVQPFTDLPATIVRTSYLLGRSFAAPGEPPAQGPPDPRAALATADGEAEGDAEAVGDREADPEGASGAEVLYVDETWISSEPSRVPPEVDPLPEEQQGRELYEAAWTVPLLSNATPESDGEESISGGAYPLSSVAAAALACERLRRRGKAKTQPDR